MPYQALAGRPNVIVDGSPCDGTVLNLSHWPNLKVPPGLEADLSAEMALAYLERFDLHGAAQSVSNNHFDQDGLVSVFALTEPDAASSRRDLLAQVAAAGDFGVYRDRTAARVSMVIAAFADPSRSPLSLSTTEDNTPTLYTELLGRLPEVTDHVDRFRELWEDEDHDLTASEELIRSGAVGIEEVPDLDLSVVSLPPDTPLGRGGHRFAGDWDEGLHPMAVHNAVQGFALLFLGHSAPEFAYRYESWVQYRSRRPRARVDLGPLAETLNAAEPEEHWRAQGVDWLTPRLSFEGAAATSWSAREFRAALEDRLAHGQPAWDPYAVEPR